jgi:hypothetical protein
LKVELLNANQLWKTSSLRKCKNEIWLVIALRKYHRSNYVDGDMFLGRAWNKTNWSRTSYKKTTAGEFEVRDVCIVFEFLREILLPFLTIFDPCFRHNKPIYTT